MCRRNTDPECQWCGKCYRLLLEWTCCYFRFYKFFRYAILHHYGGRWHLHGNRQQRLGQWLYGDLYDNSYC